MEQRTLEQVSAKPLYKQLIDKLRGDIASGVYPIHSRIPSEQEICEAYHVSRVTVRKAMNELVQDGLLERQQGKGTFVSIPKIRRDLNGVTGFSDSCRMMGCEPGTRVIHLQLTHSDEMDRENQLTAPGEQVVEIVRLRMADGQPVMLEVNHFPLQFMWLMKEDLTASLYGMLSSRGIEPTKAAHEVSLGYATGAEARLLGVESGAALLQLNEMIYDQDGKPMHTSRQKIRGDRFTFRI